MKKGYKNPIFVTIKNLGYGVHGKEYNLSKQKLTMTLWHKAAETI